LREFDEVGALESRLAFMAEELGLEEVLLIPGQDNNDAKSNAAMPLQPSLLYE